MALIGRGGSVRIGANTVAGISQWSIDCEAENVDVTDFDSLGWKEFLAGLREWSGSFEGNFTPGDTNGQIALSNAWLNGTTVSLELRFDATRRFTGTALISNLSAEVPVDEKASISFDYQGTAALTMVLT